MVCFNFVLCIGAMGCAPIWECWWPVLLMATYSSSECSKGLCRKREYTTCSRQSPHISVMGRCRTSQYLASPGKMLKEAKCLEFAAQAMGLFISLTMGAIEFTEWTVQLEVATVSVGTCLVSFFFLFKVYNWNVSVGPIDVAIWGDYLLVLDEQCLAIFTPMGILIKKCSITLKCRPVSLNISGKMLVLTRYSSF